MNDEDGGAVPPARTVDVHFHVGAPNELWGAPLRPRTWMTLGC